MKKTLTSINIFLLIPALCLSLASCGSKSSTHDGNTESTVAGSEILNTEAAVPESEVSDPEPAVTEADGGSGEAVDAEPILTEINHYVLSAEDEYYITGEKMAGYQAAVDAIFAHEPEVRLTDSYDDNLLIYGYLKENPYTFVVSSYDFTEDHTGLRFEYDYSAEECTRRMEFMDQEYLELINSCITADMTELEQVLAIYQYFAGRISYDYDWVEAMNMSEEQYLFPDIVIYQALTTGKGVCHTYSYLCQFAFQQLGIDCVRAQADMTDSGEGHMWLIVWIDGIPYHIDPTWDDMGDSASLRYFGMTDEENIQRGITEGWGNFIDSALEIQCTDTRFSHWRDIIGYTLTGNHRMEVIREDGSSETIDLSQKTW